MRSTKPSQHLHTILITETNCETLMKLCDDSRDIAMQEVKQRNSRLILITWKMISDQIADDLINASDTFCSVRLCIQCSYCCETLGPLLWHQLETWNDITELHRLIESTSEVTIAYCSRLIRQNIQTANETIKLIEMQTTSIKIK